MLCWVFCGGCCPTELGIMLNRPYSFLWWGSKFSEQNAGNRTPSNVWQVFQTLSLTWGILVNMFEMLFVCVCVYWMHIFTGVELVTELWITPTPHSKPHSQRKQAGGIYFGFPWDHYQWNFGPGVLKNSEWGFWNSIRLPSSEHIVWCE